MAPSQSEYDDVVIETALIVDVNMRTWTVDLMTQFSDKPLFGVPWTSPYLNSENGQGIFYVPEVGTQCLLVTPSDGDASPFVMGFLPIPKGDSFRANRIDMNPGDAGIMTRDGNYVLVRAGGVIQVGSTQTAQRMYLPVNNTVRDFAENYSLTTFGGELVWETDTQNVDNEQTPTRYVLRAKDHAEQQQGGAEYFPISLTVGRTLPKGDKTKRGGEDNLASSGLQDAGSPLLELSIAVPGQQEFNLALDGSGNLFAKMGSARWDFEKDLKVNIKGDREVVVKGTDTLRAENRVEEYTSQKVSYTRSEEVGSLKSVDVQSAFIGNSKLPQGPPIIGPEFVRALPLAFEIVSLDPTGPKPIGKLVPGPGFAALANAFSKTLKIT